MDELDVVSEASLATFVQRWYGPADRPAAGLAIDRWPTDRLPPPLVGWYELARRRSVPLSRDHVFYPPEGLTTHDGAVVFWADDQRTECWGFAPGEADPQVFEQTEGGAWVATGVALSRFLVYVAVYEAVYAPMHGLVRLEAGTTEIDAATSRLLLLADPLWQWPDPTLRFWADDDVLLHAGAGRIVVGARHRDALGRFDGYRIGWDWDSRVDG